ncbi:CHAT domain-containing protein [Streptomyces cyaneochromogenes]|uniref:CHAT domain-containing protein n=1 Tax=Streptomyces cyaneochromogenes TaxID=2496836 RepID=A0A3S9M9G8_9ACTN|nr:CHAT domain-containing protein [Streptomyces cyaneochromogenes]AZQ35794.1 CHAT domain-containing protein [Streptomyces cyaneochromogenes]
MRRRDELVGRLAEALRWIGNSGDPSLALTPGLDAMAAEIKRDLDESGTTGTGTGESGITDTEARHALGWLKWYQFQALPQGLRKQAVLEEALEQLTPAAITMGLWELPEPLLSALADRAAPRLLDLLEYASAGSDTTLLSYVVDHWVHLVNATPEGHPERPHRLAIVCGAFWMRFSRTGDPRDLDGALATGRRAVEIASERRHLVMALSNLGAALKGRYDRTRAEPDLHEAVTVARRAVEAAEGFPGQGPMLANLGAVLQARFGLKGDWEDLAEATTVARRALAATSADNPDRAAMLNNLSTALRSAFAHRRRTADLDEAVRVGRACVEAGAAHPDRARYLTTLGEACHSRFRQTRSAADLDEAVDALRRAVEATPAGQEQWASRLAELGSALRSRYDLTGARADLRQAMDVLRRAATATPPHVRRPTPLLLELSRTLNESFRATGAAAEGDEAVDAARQAVESVDDADRSARALMLTNLGTVLLSRHEKTNGAADLDEAIDSCRRAVTDAADDDLHRELSLIALATALWKRFELLATPEDLDAAVTARQLIVEVTAAGHAERCARLRALSTALIRRYEREEALDDLHRAIAAEREGLEAAQDGSGRTACAANLCSSLFIRFDRLGDREDLDEAVAFGRVAVAASDDPSDDALGTALRNLSQVLLRRSRLTRSLPDLDEAVGFARRAADTAALRNPDGSPNGIPGGRPGGIPSGSPEEAGGGAAAGGRAVRAAGEGQSVRIAVGGRPEHADCLDQLADCLGDRFQRTRSLADADELVEARRRTVEATAPDAAGRAGRLAALSFAYRLRYERAGRRADLDASVEAGRGAVDASLAEGSQRALYLASLSNALHFRFQRNREAADLDEALEFGRRALERATGDGEDRVQALSNLCHLLEARFDFVGDRRDLDEAVDTGRQALDAASADHGYRPATLLVTAAALRSRFIRGKAPADKEEALRLFTELVRCETAPPTVRIQGARFGALLIDNTDPALEAELLETGVLLLPELASHRMGRADQEYAIASVAEFADSAAGAVLADTTRPLPERAQRALSLLEAGRAVLLGQTLDARSDLAELRRVHPELAARFAGLRESLDRDIEPLHAGNAGPRRPDDRVDAAAQMTALLGRIRALDGFAGFALPPTADELRSDAGPGPVVTFVLHDWHSHALLLTADGVTALSLPALTPRAVIDNVNAFHVALREATDPDADRVAAQAALGDILKWLWDSAAGPVLEALGHDTTPAEGITLPRLWWAPSGRLGMLPLHAAGHHDDPVSPARRTVMDRVVSSYTPTIRALRHARRRRSAAGAADRSLVVAMPTTPGLPQGGPLRYVEAETEALARLLPDPLVLIEPDPDPDAASGADDGRPLPTRDLVLAELPGRGVVHFACHGDYDHRDPSASRLLLHDHEHSPLTVGSLAGIDLEDAQLTYLSACHTALNAAGRLLDESLHLAGAFQLAGFPGVVGSLWMVDDEVAVDIAEDFYSALRDPRDGTLDLGRAAHALHRAARRQRDLYPRTPSLWAAHLYTGA